ncbi:MAG: efflux RND transporter permease subunit [Planctomycetes bacterium]|nr:efflux RND transporter permease subunit [Planctomycetota bacterium]
MSTPAPSPQASQGSALFRLVTTRPVAVLCVVAAFCVFGWVALGKLETTLMPDLEYPRLTIRTNYPAAAPSEVEEKVSQRIEERLGNVPGLVSRGSISRAESSDVILQFAWGADMLQATADVRDRLDRIDFDDEAVERPQILRYDPGQDPTMRLMLFSTGRDVGLLELRAFADDVLKPELAKIEGVAAIRVSGGQERQIRVALLEAELNRNGLTAQQVVDRIRGARVDASAGVVNLAGLDVILRVVSTYESIAVLEDLEIATSRDGRVTLKDIAVIEAVPRDRTTITRMAAADTGFKAREGVLLEVLKEGDANIVQVAQRVWKALYGESRYKDLRAQRGEGAPSGGRGGPGAGPMGGGRSGFSRGGGMRMGGGGGFSMGPKALVDQLPEGFGLQVLSDQSYFIEDAVNDVTSSAVLGALLAVLVLFFFLRSLKATLLIAASIPLSIITTFIPLQLAGVSLNLMSLGGLALGVGMLVDNSVVVLESIARCREEGDPPLQAAIRGVSEVGGAILASTMTTVAVFFPIVFVEGMAGQIFRDLSLTVVFSLLASLIVAQFVVPAFFGIGAGAIGKLGAFEVTSRLMRYWRKPEGTAGLRTLWFWFSRTTQAPVWLVGLVLVAVLDAAAWVARWVYRGSAFVLRWVVKPFSLAFELAWKLIETLYPPLLRVALAQPMLMLAAVVLCAGAAALTVPSLETELLPSFTQDEFYADISAPEGTRIEDTDREAAALATRLLADEDTRGRVSRVSVESGGEDQAGDARPVGSHRARMVVNLRRAGDAATDGPRMQARLRALALESVMFQSGAEFGAPSLVRMDTGLEVEVRGDDYVRLGRAAARLAAAMRELPDDDGRPLFADVRSSLSAGRPQVQLVYDRLALQRHGLTAENVTREVRNKIGGAVSTRFSSGGEDLDVFVELQGGDKENLERVRLLEVAPAVRLLDVLANAGADLRVMEGPSEIRRVGNERAVVIFAQPRGAALSRATAAVQELVQSNRIDLEDADVGFSGQVQEMERSTLSLTLALLLAVFLVYVVMAVQFESLLDPLLIMFSVPLAAAGVVGALLVFNMPISVMVLLGLIVLAGIVVNNAIVLVEYANLLRSRGQTLPEAARNAARIRLRPIAITTLTTLLGLLPMTGWLDPVMPAVVAAAKGMDAWLLEAAQGMGRSLTAPADWPTVGGMTFSLAKGVGFLVGGGEGAEVRKPLAVTVIAGLGVSTLLTLVVIPTLWAWVHSLRKPKLAA